MIINVYFKRYLRSFSLFSIKALYLNLIYINIQANAESDYSSGVNSFSKSIQAIDLGMGQVPVLDQKENNIPLIYATVAGIDAHLNKGDFIDAKCTNQLMRILYANNGVAFGINSIIQALLTYGVVEKDPAVEKCPNSLKMSLDDYKNKVNPSIGISNIHPAKHSEPNINILKQALQAGKRVILTYKVGYNSFSDYVAIQGFDLKMNNKTYIGGLWACVQPKVLRDYCDIGSTLNKDTHSILVIGFDDSQELLKLRNSWGTFGGEQGDYYMTYTFFEKMGIEFTEI